MKHQTPATLPDTVMASDVPVLNKDKHVSYWLRCLRTPLPTQYTSMDANRMTLAFFTLSALDTLGVLFTKTTATERQAYADWIYQCQHPDGGFRGFPGTDFGDRSSERNKVWDAAHLPASYFAVSALCVLGDDLARIDRRKCLRWLSKMQREDGSFGEVLGEHGRIEGGVDTRFGYCAMALRWILRGDESELSDEVADLNVDSFVDYTRQCQTFDGGIAVDPFLESHAGLTYCAVGALAFLSRLGPAKDGHADTEAYGEPVLRDNILEWLVARLTTELEDNDATTNADDASVENEPAVPDDEAHPQGTQRGGETTSTVDSSFEKMQSMPASTSQGDGNATPATFEIGVHLDSIHWIGFNGRTNKIADTCYAFWVTASLKILGRLELVDIPRIRCYLLERTQHLVMGGFSKVPGDLPDIYHSYLGLATLAIINGHSGDAAMLGSNIEDARSAESPHNRTGDDERILRAFDPMLCFSHSARRWVESLPWKRKCG